VGASAAFYDQPQYRYVRSWFNRQRVNFDSGFVQFGPGGGSGWFFVSAAAYVVAFANEVVYGAVNGFYQNSGTGATNDSFGFAIDGNVQGQYCAITSIYQNVYYALSGAGGAQVAEGEHNLGAYCSSSTTVQGWIGISGTVG
jgi:hypothetical protein